MILLKIALRNLVQSKRRSLLVGLTLFITTFMLLISNAVMNGVEDQVISGYVNYQSGHVAVVWSEMQDVSGTDPGRFIDNLVGFRSEHQAEKERAIASLRQYLAENSSVVSAVFPAIVRPAHYSFGDYNSQLLVYSLTEKSALFLQDANTLKILDGKLPDWQNPGVTISQMASESNGIKIGDVLTLRGTTIHKEIRELDVRITGIYANGAGYDNWYAFMPEQQARELYDIPSPFFDITRIYLNSAHLAGSFGHGLDTHLLQTSPTLRAEPFREASPFFMNNSRIMRMMFNVFILFLLVVIAFGLMSTIRMNLFQRMKEFGTLRAIGFSRAQSYWVIFAELFLLATASMAVALVCALVLLAFFGHTGIYVGTGAISYGVGGERFWPVLRIADILLVLGINALFSLLATVGPGLNICYQQITDLIVKRQRRLSVSVQLLRELRGANR